MRRGVDVELRDSRSWTPLIFAASSGASEELIRFLVESGAALDGPTRQGMTPLMAAINHNILSFLKILLLNLYYS